MMTASQFYVMARRLEDAYAAQMRSLCKETGVAQTAMVCATPVSLQSERICAA